jgi:murein DD-endopeptidase MepM/ murein hydrolase activator NlpD
MRPRIDGLAIIALVLLLFLGGALLSDAVSASTGNTRIASQPTDATPIPTLPDPEAVTAPYKHYVVTQGPHGFSYGQMAVDLAAGAGTPILSPINGTVTERYTDQYGNPTLIIENEIYRATLLHGDYTVDIGQSVALGDEIGTESNHGFTTDMAGNLCWGRVGCGDHTHLNIFDKRIGQNVNPLDLIGK